MRKEVANAIEEAIEYLSYNVPVDTGAYSRSMHLNPRGNSGGHGETSRRKERGVDRDVELNDMEARLRASLEGIDVTEGVTFVNNAPHAKYVEARVGIFDQLRDILTGYVRKVR
jgi:hypothetical protein